MPKEINHPPGPPKNASAEKIQSTGMNTMLWILLILLLGLTMCGVAQRQSGFRFSISDWSETAGKMMPPNNAASWRALVDEYLQRHPYIDKLQFAEDDFKTIVRLEFLRKILIFLSGFVLVLTIILAIVQNGVWKRFKTRFLTIVGWYILHSLLRPDYTLKILSGFNIAAYLIVTYLLFGAIVKTIKDIKFETGVHPGESKSVGLRGILSSRFLTFLILAQVFVGSLFSAIRAADPSAVQLRFINVFIPMRHKLMNPEFGSFFGNLESNPVFTQFIHGWLVMAILVFYTMMRFICTYLPFRGNARSLFRYSAFIFIAQIVIGIMSYNNPASFKISVLHSTASLIFFGLVAAINFDLRHNVGEVKSETLTMLKQRTDDKKDDFVDEDW